MAVVGLLVGGPFLFVFVDLATNRKLRRLATRNIARRPTEAALVVVGSMLGTAIITAAFIVGDSFERSIVEIARTSLGPVDVIVQVDGLDQRDDLQQTLAGFDDPNVDGTLWLTSIGAAVATTSDEPRAEAFSGVGEIDFDAGRAFGAHPEITGLADVGATPGPGEVVINEDLATTLAVGIGDQVDVFTFGGAERLTIRSIMPSLGLGGLRDLYVAPGTIERLAEVAPADAAPPSVSLLVSNVGSTFDGADRTDAVEAVLEARTASLDGVEIEGLKRTILDDARAEGDSIGQLFVGIGSFSVLVGVLLLVNLFVMLAEERKRELGMLRAIGMKRNHLQRAFAMEGAIYAVIASLTGGFVGIGVGWAIGRVTQNILASDDDGLEIILDVVPSSIMSGMAIGLVISLVTVLGTSVRISRLNVIRALRDLPEPKQTTLTRRALFGSLTGIAVGALLASTGTAVGLISGPSLALLATIPLLRRRLGERLATVVPSASSLLWGVAAFAVAPSQTANAGIEVFVVQGVVLVSSSVLLLSTADPMWTALTDRLVGSGRGLATRLALAYPLARKVRTGILLSMFSLIIFTMTFMSVFTEIFGSQAATFADKDRGGFDILLDSNFSNPVAADALASFDGVVAVASFVRAFPDFTTDFRSEPRQWGAAGFDRALIDGGVPQLVTRALGFETDREVFEAVLADPELAIAPDRFLSDGGGPPSNRVAVGDVVTMYDPTSNDVLEVTLVGITDADFVFNGLLTSRTTLVGFLGENTYAGRHYVTAAPDVDPTDLAVRLEGAFLPNGVQATPFLDAVERELAQQQGFFRLMQGYLGLGLLIGVAGLGVVMVRAVRERRHQVGVLRALGFGAATVRRAFLLEAAFIAAQGIVLGIGLGLLTAYQVLVNSSTFGEARLPFAVPWTALAVILVVPLVASIAASVSPAAQAARIRPAAALRIAD